MNVCAWMRACVCVCVCLHACMHMCVCVCVCVCVCAGHVCAGVSDLPGDVRCGEQRHDMLRAAHGPAAGGSL